ncbi:hypothetical protein [Croceivirga thetidis]|uniref:Lipoprotein n=1 Tax=Croceivirga thetidis TaxID=2721623 RepID=A0ABX1GLS6_9FLAO|nr:hypothetical protein [Croceivirga thetidis]NKI30569.1 hypothetical protein [Croceivirga thetidis]
MKKSNTFLLKKSNLLFFVVLLVLSCSKKEDRQLISFEGRVFEYDGPYVSNYETIPDVELTPLANVELVMIESGPCGWHSCEELQLPDVVKTNAQGRFSVIIDTRVDRKYFIRARFPREVRYSATRGERVEEKGRVLFADIILVKIPD